MRGGLNRHGFFDRVHSQIRAAEIENVGHFLFNVSRIYAAILACFSLGSAGSESWRYYRLLRKRLRIGLAKPIVADSFRLWAVGILCAMLLSGISAICAQLGISFTESIPGILLTGIMGSISAGCVWFAFIPPAGYVRWIEAQVPASADAVNR